MAPAIEVGSLTKRFGDTIAVNNLDLTVNTGSIFGLVGPDGAGKTTLFRLLVTAMKAQQGFASVLGHDVIRHAQEVKKQIGYLSQQFSLYRDLSVLENIHFFRDIHKVDRKSAENRIARLLEFSRLVEFKNRPAGKLSGGMKQKLSLCCALIHTPKVLFLDEPTTGVDPISRRELWDLLYDLWNDDMTIIISTPYMDEAERCTDVAFMQDGRILTRGTPKELIEGFPKQIACITTLNAKEVKNSLLDSPLALQVHQHGEIIQVITENYSAFETKLQNNILEIDKTADVRKVSPNLEDVFLYLERRES